MRRALPLLAFLVLLPLASLFAQSAGSAPGCVQERIAEVSSNGLAIDFDGNRVPFITSEDPLGENPGHLNQLYLWRDGVGFDHLKNTNRPRTFDISTDAAGRRIAFVSDAPLTPANSQRQQQVFLWDPPVGTRQITHHDLDEVYESSLDSSGTRIAFVRTVYDAPISNPIRWDLVLWEEGVGERVVATSEDILIAPTISGDGRRVVFYEIPDVSTDSTRIRLWDDATNSTETLLDLGPNADTNLSNPSVDFDGGRIAFSATIDPLGTNPERRQEVFLWDRAEGLQQLTAPAADQSRWPSISDDGRAVAFLATVPTPGGAGSPMEQVFLWREQADGNGAFTRVTDWLPGPNPELPGGAFDVEISGDGRRIVHARFHLGPDEAPEARIAEIWISDCATPAPPYDQWLRSPGVPGFETQVRIAGEREGVEEPLCIDETLCVSGALPGRSEVFVRVVGPKGNGRLWPTLVKFSTSEVEVWIRQISTGEIEYYRLAGARPGFDELPGLFDREGFEP